MTVEIRIVKDDFTPLLKKLGSRAVGQALGNAGYDVAQGIARELKTASRQWKSISGSIKTERRGNINQVKMAQHGIMLDSMEPHYVALKRGRAITRWTRQHMPLKRKTGRSIIRTGKLGGILFNDKSKSFLYVTPTPWIDEPMQKGLSKAPRHIKKHMMRLIKQKGG